MNFNLRIWCVTFLSACLAACGGGGGAAAEDSVEMVTPPGQGELAATVAVIGAAGQLVSPQHMTYYGGNLYLVDVTSQVGSTGVGTVKKFNTSGVLQASIGTIENPVGVAFDTAGTMFVTGKKPSAGQGVLQVDTNGTVTEKKTGLNLSGLVIDGSSYTYVAAYSLGKVLSYNAGFVSGSDIAVSNQPVGLGYDSVGNGIFITRFSGGSQGLYRFSTTASPVVATAYATSSYFNQPNAIAIRTSPSLEIYVVNTGGRSDQRSILKISSNGAVVETYLSATNVAHKLCNPTGIATDGSNLYIANSTCSDGYSPNNTGFANSLVKVTF
jgi:hypothetical protein